MTHLQLSIIVHAANLKKDLEPEEIEYVNFFVITN